MTTFMFKNNKKAEKLDYELTFSDDERFSKVTRIGITEELYQSA